jgi:hypothetical protein
MICSNPERAPARSHRRPVREALDGRLRRRSTLPRGTHTRQENDKSVVVGDPAALGSVASRRSFLRALGLGGSVVLLPSVFAACKDSSASLAEPRVQDAYTQSQTVSLNLSNDIGILNYAYALEQLEAGFYSAVVAAPVFATLSVPEQEVMTDLRNHEVIHRDFLKAALGTAAIGTLQADFSAIIGDRATVLANARVFEDLGVAAYNGAGKYLRDAGYLLLAGKIVSVEARHAAAIRDILDPTGMAFASNMFENILDTNAVERAFEPAAVIATVNSTKLVKQPIAVGVAAS